MSGDLGICNRAAAIHVPHESLSRLKDVIFRIDVCKPTPSLLLNRLNLRFGYLRYLNSIISLMREHSIKGTFMFMPNRTEPTEELVGRLVDLGCEIALHADEVVVGRLLLQKETMQQEIRHKIHGVSYHGGDLLDRALYSLTHKRGYFWNHNPFASLGAGFEYDSTGYVSDKPEFLTLGTKRILLFHGFTHITAVPEPLRYDTYDRQSECSTARPTVESMFDRSPSIFLIHPFWLNRYGLRKSTLDSVRKVFDYIRRKDLTVRTYQEALERIVSATDKRP